ncbi:hypothetical protein NKH77_22445 [Streptomyces sp. M19]
MRMKTGRPSSGHRYDLVVLGELNADVVTDCGDVLPRFGQAEQIVDRAALTLGSSGAITASAAAALGCGSATPGSSATTRWARSSSTPSRVRAWTCPCAAGCPAAPPA